jgi:hypothetical protein
MRAVIYDQKNAEAKITDAEMLEADQEFFSITSRENLFS